MVLLPQKDAEGKLQLRAVTLLISVIIAGHCLSIGGFANPVQSFREAANWLYSQSNAIFNSDTVIIATSSPEVWQDYYICCQGRRDPLNVVGQDALSEEELISYNKVYVQYSHNPISESLQAALDENYVLEADTPFQLRTYTRK